MTVSPFRFPNRYQHGGFTVEYSNESEVCQGCPEVGDLLVNGVRIPNLRFGGPLVFEEEYMYGPAYRKFQFHLAVMHLPTLRLKVYEAESLVLIERVSNGRVEYFTDLENRNRKVKQVQLFH